MRVLCLSFSLLIVSQLTLAQDQAAPVTPPIDFEPLITSVPQSRHHYTLEYVQFFMRDLQVWPLVTTGPDGTQGIPGQPGTQTLLGDGRLPTRHGRYIGIRGSGEWWLNDAKDIGLDLNVTIHERNTSLRTFQWTDKVLARPFIDANTGAWDSFLVAGPAAGRFPAQIGSINVYSRMELFHEDGHFMFNVLRNESTEANLLLGAHFTQFRERLDIISASRDAATQSILTSTEDHIQTFNRFYGLQFGVKGRHTRGRWTLDARSVLAIGFDDQLIRTKGFRVFHTPATRVVNDYGLYFLPSNIGSFSRIAFDMLTENNLNLTFQVTERLSVRAGYSVLTWSNPVRPSDQIVPINLNQIGAGGGPNAPLIPFKSDFFWAHGFNVGMDFRW